MSETVFFAQRRGERRGKEGMNKTVKRGEGGGRGDLGDRGYGEG